MRKLLFIFLLLMSFIWVIPENLLAANLSVKLMQDKVITGTVSDASGVTLPAVSVRLKGTTTGISTDINGKYRISVPDTKAVLVFSFVGYGTQEVVVGNRTEINITLSEEKNALNEVVVVGYGTQKKITLTGSVSSVNFDEKLTDRTVTNMSTALSGLIPGLAVQQSTSVAGSSGGNILIRGLTSPTSGTKPLIVVDGITDVDINRIDINDVENVSVLKDAAAAVYGTRASTGVIIITTKSGKGLKTPKVSYTGTYAGNKPTNFYNFLTDYPMALTLEQRASRNGRTQPSYYDGTIDEWLSQGMVDPIKFPEANQLDYLTRRGKITTNNISAAGSSEIGNYFVSIGAYDERGYVVNNDAKRYTLRSNIDYKIRKNVTVGTRLDGQWTNQTYGMQNGFLDYSNGNANAPLTVAISGLLPYNPNTQQYGGAMAYGELSNADNLYAEIVGRHNLVQRQEFNGLIYGEWRPFKGFSARIDYSLRYYNQFNKSYTDLGVDLYNFQTGGTVFNLFPATSSLGNSSSQGYKTMSQAKLDYTTEPFKGHHLSVLALASEEYFLNRGFGVSAGGRLDQSITELGNQTLAPLNNAFSGSSNEDGLRSFVGRINYNIDEKYLFEASFRADGSARFLPGHQWGYFPGVSAGWRISEEKFFKPLINVVSSAKLRLSWGSLGNNQGNGLYNQLQTFTSTPYVLNGNVLVSGVSADKQVNPDYTWEKTRIANIGLDLGFVNNKLTVEIDAYDKLTTNLIRPSSLSTLLTGYVPPSVNIGTFRNNGIEMNLSWKSNINKFNYGATFNIAYNIDRLEAWSQHLNFSKNYLQLPWFFAYYQKSYGIAQNWQQIYDAPFQNNANIAPGDLLYKDLNGNGQVDSYDKYAVPGTNEQRPTFNYGMNLFASYKGFDMSILLQAATGRKDYFLEDITSTNIGGQRFNFQKLYLDQTWSLDTRNALYPRLEAANAANNRVESDFWLESMDYLRFKNIQVGYTIPSKPLKKIGIDRIRIYGTAENLFTISSWRGIDPEKSTLNNSQGGVNYSDDPFPILKSYSFGINLSF
jgi:TonB-linked SusC/RagA family outer membrane protein